MEEISRRLLAQAGEQHVLSEQALDAALELAGLRPNQAEWRDFGVRAMRFPESSHSPPEWSSW